MKVERDLLVRLTRREREIAALVAEGLTNREIAERLFIGVRTAEFHVEQLRGKLGVRTRAQVATWWVAQQGASEPDAVGGSSAPAGPAVRVDPDGAAGASTAPTRAGLAAGVDLRTRLWRFIGLALLLAISLIAIAAVAVPRYLDGRRGELPGPLDTVAGTGAAASTGDGGPAAAASLREPNGIVADTRGSLYVADGNRIRRIARDQNITTVAGSGDAAFGGDGGSALLAKFAASGGAFGSTGIALDGEDALYVADAGNQRVRRVRQGIISTYAGTGVTGSSGDGGPAAEATLNEPRGVVVDGGGNVFIAEAGGNRVREIDPAGVISTFAGTGVAGSSGDGGPATEATLNGPTGLALGPGGYLYIADTGNNRIRRVSPDGTIATVAGDGRYGFSGDGGPAVHARLALPHGLAVSSTGLLYLADSDNNRIRRVDEAGVISTVAGTGQAGFSGDGGPGSQGRLNRPQGVALGPDGQLFIADAWNQRVRVLREPAR